jgi:membrane-bound lytic murein transglycosylase D
MKTMLKRKLYRAGALCYCFLFISIANPLQSLSINDTSLIKTGTSISDELVLTNALTIGLNKKAGSFLKIYLKKNNQTLIVARQRSKTFFSIMDSVFVMYDLPVQLKYIAVVESNLKTSAGSHAGAAGIWQLMPLAAKSFGLKVTEKVDDRFHVYKSTVAAARYMKLLYAEFGDWLLAIAAYNAGSGRVHYAMRQAGSHDFWQLQNFLPAETREHVKKFIGVHFYFEGQGSVTTMTKAEIRQYEKTVAEFTANNSVANPTIKDFANKP